MRLFLSLAWLITISIAMLTPGDKFPEVDAFDFQDKFIHFICFSLLSFLWCGVGIKPHERGVLSKRLLINYLIFGVLAGIILEYLQQFIPFRTYDYIDMAVNEIGGIAGFFAYFKLSVVKNNLE
ncbi:VanZ family protein [Algoriphagus halophilus]|uniref:VanZ like family protein n=1 Tax=Algoriphagus halophilus TaxID=226505 RepID=A0A1N6D7I1_9BACT|nr:VanZ family protein [Algoriphagus halophilus]SIN66735.1 VanZ like family protein [Algoriphagus halophilus]